jgi:hypothetical protein
MAKRVKKKSPNEAAIKAAFKAAARGPVPVAAAMMAVDGVAELSRRTKANAKAKGTYGNGQRKKRKK